MPIRTNGCRASWSPALCLFPLLVACGVQRGSTVADTSRVSRLESDVASLQHQAASLEAQLAEERLHVDRAERDASAQRDRVAVLERAAVLPTTAGAAPSEQACAAFSIAEGSSSAEGPVGQDVRFTHSALMLALERMDISSSERAVLKGSLRQVPLLDRDNPWMAVLHGNLRQVPRLDRDNPWMKLGQ